MLDVTVDFELYYDKEYSLDRMSTTEYVLDPRFEIIGCGVRTPDGKDHWISGDANHVRAELLRLVPDWSTVRVVAHNARLEASVLEWRLGIKPAAYFCTMVGSRPHILPYTRSVSLYAVADYLDAGKKGDYVEKAKGKHRTDFTGPELAEYGVYCVGDVDLSTNIFDKLDEWLPVEEQEIMDLTIKKFVRPKLHLSVPALTKRLEEMEIAKEKLAEILQAQYNCTLKDVRSRPKFAALLQGLGVEPPMKLNKKGEATYAFAKDDLGFKELLTHEDQKVRDLVSAKMALSSTMEEGRIRKLIRIAELTGGALPVPLVYYGAHPGRLSGDDEINLQNLPRVVIDKKTGVVKKGHLRYTLIAPPGYSVVAADFSNIEARIVAVLAGQADLVEGFRDGRDIYSEFATKIYGYEVNKVDNPKERFVGKTCILGLGYGMGHAKFHLKVLQEGIAMDTREAARVVQLYRSTYHRIPLLWRWLESMAHTYMLKKGAMYPHGPFIFCNERIILPNGMPLIYPGLRWSGGGFTFDSRFVTSQDGEPVGRKIWGGMYLENVSQALARIIASRAELKLAHMNLPTALQVHDELVWVVPTAVVDKVKTAVALVMTQPVDFLPALPVAVEVKHGPTYGDAK